MLLGQPLVVETVQGEAPNNDDHGGGEGVRLAAEDSAKLKP